AYYQAGCDELVFLDITATHEKRDTTIEMVKRVADQVFIPFTVGGGIRSVEDMNRMLKAGADKVAVNSSALNNPQLIRDCAQKFGSQCVVLAVDAKKEADGSWHVYLAGGRKDTGRDLLDWVQEAVQLGAGEILLTSMDKDGTKSGFDLPMLKAVVELVNVPIIASGGAGSLEHMVQVFQETPVTGALAASIFHYGEVSIKETKEAMAQAGLEARL
ncbi:imidazole glycerol phosphate synthase subunit HisF, partial [Streptococcus sobrinus]